MNKIILHTIFVIVVMNLCLYTCEGFRNRNSGSSQYNREPISRSSPTESPYNNDENTTRRGLGISAWGIVTVVISLILAIAGMYYFSICYPVLCKKNKKYDMMGLTTVA